MSCLYEEEIHECLYSRPKIEGDSKEDYDEEAAEELACLK
jgi:hypothetical protein